MPLARHTATLVALSATADTGDLSPIACGNTAPATPMPLSRHTAALVALSAAADTGSEY